MASNEHKRPRQESSDKQQHAPASKRRRRQRLALSKKHGSEIRQNDGGGDSQPQPIDVIAGYQLPADLLILKQKLLSADHDNYMKQKQDAHHHVSSIINSMSVRQEHRYECWNRSAIPKNIVKSIMNNVLNQHSASSSKKKSNVDDKCVIVMQALTKCLVMELVNKSRHIQKESIAHFMHRKEEQQQQQQSAVHDASQLTMGIVDPPLDLDALLDDDDAHVHAETNVADQSATTAQETIIEHESDSNQTDQEHLRSNDKQELDDDASGDVCQDQKNTAVQEHDAISGEFMMGPIRPIHIRDALRALQNDKASFFHSNTYLFSTKP
mmetsp:Transcript_12419/g.18745  ORF Transcript_12419/g.18745 Transcript_12419/m.18745 type:complete len:325 (+) Transcript_12419:28-1002(+)